MNQDISKVKIYYSKEKKCRHKKKKIYTSKYQRSLPCPPSSRMTRTLLLEWKSHEKKDTSHALKSFWLNFQANNFLIDKIVSNKAVCVCVYIYTHTHIYIYICNVLASFMCHILPAWSTQDRNNCQFLSFTRWYSLAPNNPCNLEFPFF